jgi:hypothetical protein
LSKFAIGDSVTTFDPNFQPLVEVDSTGTITKVYDEPTRALGTGYDVLLVTNEGTKEEFYFHEFELSEGK